MSSSATRRSSLHSLYSPPHEPSSSLEQPGHSILLNGGLGSPSTRSDSPTVSGGGFPRIHFAPLPQVPPELKRRSSITLGVAARKNLLSNQQSGNHRVLTMNDADWENYKKQYEASNAPEPVDLGELAKSGAKMIWRRVRSASGSANSITHPTSGDQSHSPTSMMSPPRDISARVKPNPNVQSVLPQAEPSLEPDTEEVRSSGPHQAAGSPPASDTSESRRETAHGGSAGQSGASRNVIPRRIPSPPPETNTLPEDEEAGDENEEEDKVVDQERASVKTLPPPLAPVTRAHMDGPVASRRRQAAVLGFDQGRYGR